MNSTLGNLNWGDLIKGLVLTVITTVMAIIVLAFKNAMQTGTLMVEWNIVAYAAGFAFFSYLSKQLGTDDQGNILGIGSK